jgi:hypothetical protein
MDSDKPADCEDKTRNIREIFDRFQEKADNLKSVLDYRRRTNEMVDSCLMCICFPCILCATCVDHFCSGKRE